MIGGSYGLVLVLITVLNQVFTGLGQLSEYSECCPERFKPLPRRYDINDLGHPTLFHGWVDVQGQGAANDYCRMVGNEPNIYLSCALAGTNGDSDYNYNSVTTGFDRGYTNTWFMRDEDGDGRDDYCRCVGSGEGQQIACSKATAKGFGKVYSFTPTGNMPCSSRSVFPEFGRIGGFVI